MAELLLTVGDYPGEFTYCCCHEPCYINSTIWFLVLVGG